MNQEKRLKQGENQISTGQIFMSFGAVGIILPLLKYVLPVLWPLLGLTYNGFLDDYDVPTAASLFFGVLVMGMGYFMVKSGKKKLRDPEQQIDSLSAENARLRRDLKKQQKNRRKEEIPEPVGSVTRFERGTDVQELPEHIRKMTEE